MSKPKARAENDPQPQSDGSDPVRASGLAPRSFGLKLDVAILLAISPLLLTGLRVWLYSGGDTAIFLTLVRTLDVATVLVGTVAVLMQGLILLGVVLILTDWEIRERFVAALRRPGVIAALAVLFLLLFYTANAMFAFGLVAIALLAGIFLALRRWVPWARKILRWLVAPKGDPKRPDSLATVASVGITLLILPTNMWLPLEQLELIDSQQQTAYVLEVSSEWTTALTESRAVRIYPTEDVLGRETCRSATDLTLAKVFFQIPPDPEAPTCD